MQFIQVWQWEKHKIIKRPGKYKKKQNRKNGVLTVKQMRNKLEKVDQSLTFCLLLWSASTFIVCVLSSSPPVSHRFTSVPQRCHIYTSKHEWKRTCAAFHRRSDLNVLEDVAAWPQLPWWAHSNHSRTHLFTLPASSALHACRMGQTPPAKK